VPPVGLLRALSPKLDGRERLLQHESDGEVALIALSARERLLQQHRVQLNEGSLLHSRWPQPPQVTLTFNFIIFEE
jgi:hypothetical protein